MVVGAHLPIYTLTLPSVNKSTNYSVLANTFPFYGNYSDVFFVVDVFMLSCESQIVF